MQLKIYGRVKLNVLLIHFVFYILKGKKVNANVDSFTKKTSNIIDRIVIMF